MIAFCKRLFKDEAGQGLSEYGLIIGLVSVGLVLVLGFMTDALRDIFNFIATKLTEAASTAQGN